MRARYFFANVLVISLSIAFLVHFGLIAYHGQVVISEPGVGYYFQKAS